MSVATWIDLMSGKNPHPRSPSYTDGHR
jgi:hypothetical protein